MVRSHALLGWLMSWQTMTIPAVEEFAQRVLNTCPYVKVAAIGAPTAKGGFVLVPHL